MSDEVPPPIKVEVSNQTKNDTTYDSTDDPMYWDLSPTEENLKEDFNDS